VSVALGQDPGGEERAAHDPSVGNLLPFRCLIGVVVGGGRGEAILDGVERTGGG